METEKIVKMMISGDLQEIRESGVFVIQNSKNLDIIMPLVPYLSEIIHHTKDLELGGAWASNNRFAKYPVSIISHYANNSGCSCLLFPEIGMDLNPTDKLNNVEIIDTKLAANKYVDYYTVVCKKCGQKFVVYECERHFVYYDWRKKD